MAAKKKTSIPAEPLKFTKGEFYQDQMGNLWCCAGGKVKTVGDQQVVQMQQASSGKPTGSASDEPVDAFVRQLTAAELKEYREVCQRERDAEEAAKTTPAPTKKSKSASATADGTEQPNVNGTNRANDQPKAKKVSALDAAAKVLGEATGPMATKEMIDSMSAKGYWTSPGGQTPHATLYAAILREINIKGAEARFTKTDRGRFWLATQVGNVGGETTMKKSRAKVSAN